MTSWLILQVIWNLKSASYALAIITIVLVNDHINFLNKQKWIKLNIENNRKKMQPVWIAMKRPIKIKELSLWKIIKINCKTHSIIISKSKIQTKIIISIRIIFDFFLVISFILDYSIKSTCDLCGLL